MIIIIIVNLAIFAIIAIFWTAKVGVWCQLGRKSTHSGAAIYPGWRCSWCGDDGPNHIKSTQWWWQPLETWISRLSIHRVDRSGALIGAPESTQVSVHWTVEPRSIRQFHISRKQQQWQSSALAGQMTSWASWLCLFCKHYFLFLWTLIKIDFSHLMLHWTSNFSKRMFFVSM